MSVTVTVNGVELKEVLAEEVKQEIETQRRIEVSTISKAAKIHIVSSCQRNHSGSRSGRGRIIMQGGIYCQ